MALFADARVPVRIVTHLTDAPPEAAVLLEGEGAWPDRPTACFTLPPTTDHAIGCACCLPRGPAAQALGHLFLARARGDVPFFREVLAVAVTTPGEAAVRAALAEDPVVSARFRLHPGSIG
jgi:hypothetical protein